MARIEDLVDEISDPELRKQIAREVKHLKSTKRFGLVYEEHVPETVSLFGFPIRSGSVVQKRTMPDDLTRWEVVTIDGDMSEIKPVGTEAATERYLSRDLLTVKRFEEPIFPGLTPVGEIRRGPDNKPWHSVINGENFHALQLLAYTHAHRVDVIYIDPPYNTGDKSWKYNNRFVDGNDAYRHSKWLAMMEKRLKLARALLKPNGVLVVTIDEHEVHHLGVLLETLLPEAARQMVTIINNPKGVSQDRFSRVEEHALFAFFGSASVRSAPDDLLTWGGEEAQPPGAKPRWKGLLRSGKEARASDRPNMCFPVNVKDDGTVVGVGLSLEERADAGQIEPGTWDNYEPALPDSAEGTVEAWPIRKDGSLGRWSISARRVAEFIDLGYIRAGNFDEKRRTYALSYLSEEKVEQIQAGLLEIVGRDEVTGVVDVGYVDIPTRRPRTVWHRSAHDAGVGGSDLLTAALGPNSFDYPKSVYSVRDTLANLDVLSPDAVVLDFFAGSGTTLHAVAMLNAEDGGHRQCILVTNNDVSDLEQKALNEAGFYVGDPEYEAQGIFEAVAKPRIQAAVTGLRPDGTSIEGSYLDQYLADQPYADGFKESVAFFRVDYLEPDLVELGRQYQAIAPLLWMTAGAIGSWEAWDGESPWSSPEDSSYAVLFDEAEAAAFGAYVSSRTPQITHAWIVTNSHSAFLDLREELPKQVVAGQLYRDYLRNFVVNAPGVAR
jgi:adenine-specific DNA-methyltransferase